MFKLNSFCKECFDPYKIVWKCKKNIDDKELVYICGNCVRYFQYLNKRNFKSQLQNIKSLINCRRVLTRLNLFLFNAH